ncbi:MAG: TolC family protein [Desulfobacterales bacterium]|nr:TolC family protein [Desulfobacterales bacterium]
MMRRNILKSRNKSGEKFIPLNGAKYFFLLMGLCFTLSACASLPKTVTRRDPLAELSVSKGFQDGAPMDSQVVNGLMDVFQDEGVQKLVTRAMEANLEIKLADRKLQELQYTAEAAKGDLLPKLAAYFSGDRTRDGQAASEGKYSPSVAVSWEVDIWKKLRNQKTAQDTIALAGAENYQAVRDAVAARVMQEWFDVVTAQKTMELTRSRLKNLEKSADNIRRRYRTGLSFLEDLVVVKRDIAQARAALIDNEMVRNTARRRLQVLMGQPPEGIPGVAYTLPRLLLPPAPGTPASLLVSRPDLRRAWQTVKAEDARVKVAHARIFPSLTLTGALGRQTRSFSDFMQGITIWSIAGQLAFPIFNADQLENRMMAAQSKAEQAWIRYLQTALTAFQEVAQALDGEKILADQERQQQEAVFQARRTARIFESRYKTGLVGILEYLAPQNTVFNMEKELLKIRNARLKNRVALALALGKGV